MDERAFEVYRRYIPDFNQTENGHFVGCCPLCGGKESFLAGSVPAETGEPTDDFFVCYLCGKEGTLKDFLEAIGEDETEPKEVESPLNPEIVDGLDFGKNFQQDRKIFTEKREKRSQESSDTKMEAILSSILKMDLPGREIRICLLLYLSGDGLTAKEISEKLQISQTNIHRYLATVERKGLIYSTGKPKRYFKTEDAERQN